MKLTACCSVTKIVSHQQHNHCRNCCYFNILIVYGVFIVLTEICKRRMSSEVVSEGLPAAHVFSGNHCFGICLWEMIPWLLVVTLVLWSCTRRRHTLHG